MAEEETVTNYGGPYGEYPEVTGVVDATAKAEITTAMVALIGLFGQQAANPGPGTPLPTSASAPGFDQIPESTRVLLANEITAVLAAIDEASEA